MATQLELLKAGRDVIIEALRHENVDSPRRKNLQDQLIRFNSQIAAEIARQRG